MRKVLVILVLAALVVGCESVGRKEYLVTNTPEEQKLLSTDEEDRFGHLVDAYVQNQYMVLQNFQYETQIQAIFDEVVSHSDRKNLNFTLRILNSNEANAFAGPGGYVYITTGLLDTIENKDELACVLAHEISHVCARHSIKQFKRLETAKAAIVILSVGAAIAAEDPDVMSPASDLGSTLAHICIQGYSRSDELQADSLVVKYTQKSAYNSLALIDLLRRLEREQEEKTGEKRIYTLLSSHPPTAMREENIRKQLAFIHEGGLYE